MKLEELEQRILAIYDARDGRTNRDNICDTLEFSGECDGFNCTTTCPLSMGYLAKMMRKGREHEGR